MGSEWKSWLLKDFSFRPIQTHMELKSFDGQLFLSGDWLNKLPAKRFQLYDCLVWPGAEILQQAGLSASHQRQEGVFSGGSSSLKVFLLAFPLNFWGSQQRILKTTITRSQGTWQPLAKYTDHNHMINCDVCVCVCVKCFEKVRSALQAIKQPFLRQLLIQTIIKWMVVK